jgi:hypothetical protein
MSFHGKTDDKSAAEPLPRSLTDLLETTQEQIEATKLGAKDRAAGLIEQLNKARLRATKEQIEWSRQGKSMDALIAFADALNATHDAKARAIILVNGLGARY